MASRRRPLQPRKTPVQARSTQTVEAIFDATVQVLLALGIERLTTTRVADRAGVSVGTLYQYFPNKQSLLAAVLRRHLCRVVEAVESACLRARGLPADEMARTLVSAFFDAKFADPAASRALYSVASEADGVVVMAEMGQRAQLALCALLAASDSYRFDDAATVAYVCSSALIGPVQGLLELDAPPAVREAVREQLTSMIAAYLDRAGSRRRGR